MLKLYDIYAGLDGYGGAYFRGQKTFDNQKQANDFAEDLARQDFAKAHIYNPTDVLMNPSAFELNEDEPVSEWDMVKIQRELMDQFLLFYAVDVSGIQEQNQEVGSGEVEEIEVGQ